MRTLTPEQADQELRVGSLKDATITGNLEFGFLPPYRSTEPGGLCLSMVEKIGDLDLSGMVVEGDLTLHHLKINGSLCLSGAKVKGNFQLEQVPIKGRLVTDGLEVNGRIITDDFFQALQFFLQFGHNIYCDQSCLQQGLQNLLDITAVQAPKL